MNICVPKWKKRTAETVAKHKEFLNAKGDDIDIIFFGDSMFERFIHTSEGKPAYQDLLSGHRIFNCSVGGDRIRHMLWRLTEADILDDVRSKPTKVIILAGANDVEYRNVIDEMIDGYTQILDIFTSRFPNAQIDVIGVYPRMANKVSEDKLYATITLFNNKLKELVNEYENVNHWYFGNDVIDQDNKTISDYFVDNVHFSKQGYILFANHLAELING